MKFKTIALLLIAIACPLLAQSTGVPRSMQQTGSAPAWLRYLGNSMDGAYVPSNGQTLSGDLFVTSFTLAAGVTISSPGLTVHSIGPCNINGTISASGLSDSGVAGGSGGGGGGGTSPGYPGGNSATSTLRGVYSGGGLGGAASGGAGAAGGVTFIPNATATWTDTSGAPIAAFRYYFVSGWGLDGFGVGGAPGGAGGNSGGAGGAGGGQVYLICASIAGTGTINASGAAGANAAANNVGAGGGGGGGAIILSSQQPLTFSGTLNVAGGAGGSCGSYTGCGAGGAGGNGWIAAWSGW